MPLYYFIYFALMGVIFGGALAHIFRKELREAYIKWKNRD